jgi:hypothetical protein
LKELIKIISDLFSDTPFTVTYDLGLILGLLQVSYHHIGRKCSLLQTSKRLLKSAVWSYRPLSNYRSFENTVWACILLPVHFLCYCCKLHSYNVYKIDNYGSFHTIFMGVAYHCNKISYLFRKHSMWASMHYAVFNIQHFAATVNYGRKWL